jgi:hypothetical protein
MACLTEPSEFLKPVEHHGQPSLQKCAFDLSEVPIENQQRESAAGKGSREKCNRRRVMMRQYPRGGVGMLPYRSNSLSNAAKEWPSRFDGCGGLIEMLSPRCQPELTAGFRDISRFDWSAHLSSARSFRREVVGTLIARCVVMSELGRRSSIKFSPRTSHP